MRRIPAAAATVALCLAAQPLAARAVISASASAPIRAGIDAACLAPMAAATASTDLPHGTLRVVRLARRGTGSMTFGPWTNATGQTGMLATAPPTLKLETVVAVLAAAALVFASDTVSDESGDGAVLHDYCYRSGKLVRAKTTIDDVSEDAIYSRTVYYDSTGALLADSGQQSKALSRGAVVQQLPGSALAIPAYLTPARQPFYAALRAATR